MIEFKKSNYRKKYLEYFGLEDDKNFQVHHLDLNIDNNNIYNLVLLPKNVHKRFHFFIAEFRNKEKGIVTLDLSNPFKSMLEIETCAKILPILKEIKKWENIRDLNIIDIQSQEKSNRGNNGNE